MSDHAAELDRLRDAATPERWVWNWKYGTIEAVNVEKHFGVEVFCPGEHEANESAANAEFAAYCANHARDIAAELRELRAEVDRLKTEVDDFHEAELGAPRKYGTRSSFQ